MPIIHEMQLIIIAIASLSQHLGFSGEYMEQALISAMWQAIHQSKVVDIRAVYKDRGDARYLAKYLRDTKSLLGKL